MESAMSTTKTLFTAAVLAFVATAATAQDHAGHGMAAAPESGGCPPAAAAPAPSPMDGLDEAHQALMKTMDDMHPAMMAGMMAEDPDVAFVCGMIAHHQGAIDMARVELEFGDDPWAREMAERVIDAQEAEIAEMNAWLAEQAE
jgi:hypothetical protein